MCTESGEENDWLSTGPSVSGQLCQGASIVIRSTQVLLTIIIESTEKVIDRNFVVT